MKKLFPLLCLLFAAGCEVLEEDISHKQVPVIAPADGVSVVAGSIDFRWSAVEYATGYEFTVVSPSFSAAGRVVADTVIWADTLGRRFGCRLVLSEGEYEWSVTGFNGGYKTRTGVRGLTVVPSDTPDNPGAPDNFGVADIPGVSEISGNPDIHEAHGITVTSGSFGNPGTPGNPGFSANPATPATPGLPGFPEP